MLQMIAQNEMNTANGQEPESAEDTSVWSDCLDLGRLLDGMDELNPRSFGGIIASLIKKGLVESSGFGDRDDTTGLTDDGFHAWREMKNNWKAIS